MEPGGGRAAVGTGCPQCGQAVTDDQRFVVWCPACGWNTDPLPAEPPRGRLEARRRKLAAKQGAQLHAELAARGAAAAPRLDAQGIAAFALSWAVHLSTAALTVVGVLLVVLGYSVFTQLALGIAALMTVAVLRPRLGTLPKHVVPLQRADAPRLFTLLDLIASEAGTRTVDDVVLTGEVNASVSEYGLRRRRLLRLGLPLWAMLTPQERVALPGHELGHYAHGDTRRGFVVGTALRTLASWCHLLRPGASRYRRSSVAVMLANVVIAIPWAIASALLWVLDRCTMRASQRAEYRADAFAARIASSEAILAVLDALLLAPSVHQRLRRQAILVRTKARGTDPQAVRAGLWDLLAEHARSVPEVERERLRRAGALRDHSIDSTHPPTHLRRSLIAGQPPVAAAVALDAAASDAIDAELAPTAQGLARTTLRDIHL